MSARQALHTFSTGLTVRGRAFLTSGLASIAAAILLSYPPLLRIGVLLAALPVVAAVITGASRYRISCRRVLQPARVPVGASAQVHLRLQNAARLPSSALLVEDRLPYTLGSRPRFILRRIEPSGHRRVAYRIRSEHRGRYDIGPLTLRSADPLGLFELSRSFTAQHTLTVVPRVQPLPPTRLGALWSGRGEGHAAYAAAAGEEDIGVREYRHGDDLRRIHWRATAHHGELMVRREERTWHSQCTILVDSRTSAHRGTGPAASYEWAVSAAASAAVHLLNQGYHVRLSTGTGAGLIPAEDQDTVLDALAVVKPVPIRALNLDEWSGGGAGTLAGSDLLVIAFLGELGPADAAELARARPGSAGGVAFLLDTATWAGPVTRPMEDRAFRDSVRILLAGGWQVVPARANDDFAELWRAAGRHGAAEDQPYQQPYRPFAPALGAVSPAAAAAAAGPTVPTDGTVPAPAATTTAAAAAAATTGPVTGPDAPSNPGAANANGESR
ncbi:DUF58 domain-containing protein [Actinospica sp.]|uniref:DUF58 domain-containing protein n=1 Tax=Actinospica sp. TaxID=1872142 RepID=UPI002C192ABC|nr:DUF58 domain-containing protein [Actinospica sp.]HWG25786.1 DUF58 domain-containing protein [Actinospica sp.]